MMRSILFVYRILLPPLFLFRLCLPRPPEADQISQSADNGVQSPQDDYTSETRDLIADIIVPTASNHKRATANSVTGDFTLPETGVTDFPLEGMETTQGNLRESKTGSKTVSKILTASLYGIIRAGIIEHARNATTNDSDHISSQPNRIYNTHQLSGGKRRQKHIHKDYLPQSLFHRDQLHESRNRSHSSYKENVPSFTKQSFNRSKKSLDTIIRHRITQNRSRRSTENEQRSLSGLKRRPPQTKPPEYMVELFQLLSGTHYEMLRNTIVTSFVNVLDEDMAEATYAKTPLVHTLAFNVFIPQGKEVIEYAEVRLFVLLNHNSSSNDSETNEKSYEISIYEVYSDVGNDTNRRLIASKTVTVLENTWIAVNVTSAVQEWPLSGFKVLEAEIGCDFSGRDNPGNLSFVNDTNSDIECSVLDIDMGTDNDPLLIIFSKKTESDHVEQNRAKREVRRSSEEFKDMATPGGRITGTRYPRNDTAPTRGRYEQGVTKKLLKTGFELADYVSKLLYETDEISSAAHIDSALIKSDKYVNSKFNESTFLKLKTPLAGFSHKQQLENHRERMRTPGQTPQLGGNHYNFQFLKGHQHSNGIYDRKSAVFENMSEDSVRMRVRRDTKLRYRRHLDSLFQTPRSKRVKRSKKRNSCRREEMYVDFETIKWDKVIIFPRGYQAFECIGKCYTPISEYLTPSKHAIIQTLVHTSYPKQASRACCVPTKLEPISILYWDEHGNIKYDYTYDGMVAAECGCR